MSCECGDNCCPDPAPDQRCGVGQVVALTLGVGVATFLVLGTIWTCIVVFG